MKGGKEVGVEPVISAKEMADPEVDHLGIMAYAAWFEHLVTIRYIIICSSLT